MSKFCKNCGKELEEGAVFCENCGTKFGENNPSNNSNINQTNRNPFNEYNIGMIDGERVIRNSEIHPGCLLAPGIVMGFGFLLALFSFISMASSRYYYMTPSDFIMLLLNPFFIIGLVWLVIRYLGYIKTDLILTNKRVFGKCGIISTIQMQCPLDKINSISYSNGIMGKILGYGTVRISTGSTHFKFRFIRDGHTLYNDIFHNFEIADKEKMAENAEAIADAIGRRIE